MDQYARSHPKNLLAWLPNRDVQNAIQECLIDSDHMNPFPPEHSIGEGQYGKVYRASYKPHNSENTMVVAVKMMKDWTLEHIEEAHMEYVKSAQDFIVDSALIMRPFKHENVMTLVGVIIDGPTPYVVLPYMDNGSLLDFLKIRNNTTATFSAADLVGLGRQVACGMAYLHEASGGKFIHRDLAARNCMVDMNAVVKIADFGLVRDADYYYRLTDHTRRLPLKWMAIESMEDNIFSSKTDVWSYGVLLWELLTLCETPYNNLYPEQLKQHLLSGRRLPKPPECPEVIYDLMLSCWEHSPDDRPSFLEILRNLEGYLSTVESEGQRNGIHDPMVDFANQFMESRSRSLTPRSRTPSLYSRRSRSPRPRSRSVSPQPRTRSRLPLRRRSSSCSPRPRSRSPPPKFMKRTRSGSRSFSPRRRRSFRGPHSYSRSRPRSHLRYPPRSYSRSPLRSYSRSPPRYCSYCSYSLSRPRSYTRSPPRSYSHSPPRSNSRSPLRSYSRSPPRYCSYCSYSLSRPRSYSWSPPHSYSHSSPCSYSRSPPRSYSRSPPRSYSWSPPRSYSWSPPRSYSRSPPRSYSRSRLRSYSRSPPRSYSRSPPRSYSHSPPHSYSHSPTRSYSHSPPHSYSHSPLRSYSHSPPRSYSRSRPRSYSRSPPHSYSWSPPYSCFYIKDWMQYLEQYQEWYAKYGERAGYPSKPPGYEMYCESLRYKSSSNLLSVRTETDNHENIHSADKKARQEKKHRRPKPSRSSSQETSHKKPRLESSPESSVSATHTGVRSHAVQTDNNTVDTAVRSHAVKADNLMVEPREWEESDDLFTLDEDEYKEAIRKNKTATAAATAAKKKPLPSSEKAEKVMDQSKFEPDYGEDMESDIVEKANVATDSAMANDSDDSPKSSDCSHGPDKKKKKKKKKPKKHKHKEHKEKKHKKSK